MTDTVRELVCAAIQNLFVTMAADQPEGDPYGMSWQVVARRDLTDAEKRKPTAMSIHDTTEVEVTNQNNRRICELDVIIEAHIQVPSSLDAAQECHRVEGVIKRRLWEDISLGGVARLLRLNKAEVDPSGLFSPGSIITIWLKVQYGHAQNDPRVRM